MPFWPYQPNNFLIWWHNFLVYCDRKPGVKVLKRIIVDNDTKAGRIFDMFIQGLIILSLISFTIETLPNLSEWARKTLWIAEVVTVAIFTIEYLLRLIFSDKKWKFILSFYGLIDLAAILPFYVLSGLDLRSVRIFRLFRLIRAFKLFRYSKAVDRFRKSFFLVKEELILFAVVTTFLLFIASVGIYYCENSAQPEQFASVFHSFWWAVATLSTVGYGDIYPVTVLGKLFTFAMLMVGLGIVAVPVGLIASSLTKTIG